MKLLAPLLAVLLALSAPAQTVIATNLSVSMTASGLVALAAIEANLVPGPQTFSVTIQVASNLVPSVASVTTGFVGTGFTDIQAGYPYSYTTNIYNGQATCSNSDGWWLGWDATYNYPAVFDEPPSNDNALEYNCTNCVGYSPVGSYGYGGGTLTMTLTTNGSTGGVWTNMADADCDYSNYCEVVSLLAVVQWTVPTNWPFTRLAVSEQ